MQLVEETTQGGAGGELGAQLTLILNLHAVFKQISDHLLVVRVFEEAMNLMSHFQADIRQVGEYLRQGLLHTLQRAERTRQDLGRLFADIGNPEGVDKARQARFLAVLDGAEQLFTGQLGEAFEVDDLFKRQGVQVSGRIHQAFIHQLLDALVAQPLNVQSTTGDEMDNRLLELRTAGQATDAAIHRAFTDGLTTLAAFDQLRALDVGTADRALLRNVHRPRIVRTSLKDHLHHLRDHITGTADDHRVANHQAQARHFIHVMQGGVGHSDASHLDRLQARHGRDRASATDLEFHVEQLGEFFHRREFMGNCPARFARAETQFTL